METLAAKFYQPIFNIDFGAVVKLDSKRVEAAKECAEICRQQAKEQSIKYNKWFLNNGISLMLDGKERSTDELFELFLKEDNK